MLDTIETSSVEKITAPAKMWRNRFLALKDGRRFVNRLPFRAGEIYDSVHVWPSKEIAEQKQLCEHNRIIASGSKDVTEWIGAFPVTP